MKKIVAMMLVVLMLGVITGCGGKDTASDSYSQEQSDTETKTDQQAESEVAKTTDALVVYSPHKSDMINPIINKFQEQTGIKVEVVAAGTGELLKRIESEKDNPLGDVMWGGGAESLNAYAQYFEPYLSTEAEHIDAQFIGKDNIWTGTSPLPMVIMYNKKLVAEKDVPTSWADLLDPKWKSQIAYADPARSGSSFTILATMLEAHKADGDDGWEFINKFYQNLDGKLTSGSSGVYKGVADGEYAVGLTLEKAAMEYVKAGAEVGIVYPSDGTSSAPDGIGLIKGAKNLENAKKFFDYVLSAESQKFIFDDFNSRPSRDDVEMGDLLPKISEIKMVDYDLEAVSANKEAIMKKWKDIVVGKY